LKELKKNYWQCKKTKKQQKKQPLYRSVTQLEENFIFIHWRQAFKNEITLE